MADSRLRVVVNAKDNASGPLGKISKGLMGLGKAAGIGVAAVGVAAIGLAAVALKIGADFDKAFSTIRVGTGATGEALDDLKDSFKNVFAGGPEAAGLVSQVLADLNTRLGITGDELEGATRQILDLSKITGTDAVGNVRLVTRVFGDWSIATDDQSDALDFLFRASQASGISIDKLLGSIVNSGAPLRMLGFSLEESTALFAKWEREGVNAETIMGSFSMAVGRFSKAGLDPAEAFRQLLIDVTAVGPGLEAIQLSMDAVGSRAGPDLAAAILEGRFEFEEFLQVIKDNPDTISGLADETRTLGERFATLKNKIAVALEPLVTPVFQFVEQGVIAMVDALDVGMKALGAFGVLLSSDDIDKTGAARDVLDELFGPDVAQKAVNLTQAMRGFGDFFETGDPADLERMVGALNELGLEDSTIDQIERLALGFLSIKTSGNEMVAWTVDTFNPATEEGRLNTENWGRALFAWSGINLAIAGVLTSVVNVAWAAFSGLITEVGHALGFTLPTDGGKGIDFLQTLADVLEAIQGFLLGIMGAFDALAERGFFGASFDAGGTRGPNTAPGMGSTSGGRALPAPLDTDTGDNPDSMFGGSRSSSLTITGPVTINGVSNVDEMAAELQDIALRQGVR